MENSGPSVFVNAEILPMYVSRRVRTVIKVINRSDGYGFVTGQSTDDQQLTVKGIAPGDQLTDFVEVIGIADSNRSIQAEIWTNFGVEFDMSSYNSLCQLANGKFKHLFV